MSAKIGAKIKPKLGRDDWTQRSFMLVIGLYLVITLALPLYAMLSKAFSTYYFDLGQYEVQVSDEAGNFGPVMNVAELNAGFSPPVFEDLSTNTNGRLGLTKLFPDFSFRSPVMYRFRGLDEGAIFLVGSERNAGPDWIELDSNSFRRIVIRPESARGISNFTTYFSTPALVQSVENSLVIATITTLITVSLAFWFAYALARSKMRFKGLFRMVAMMPILVPSLLPGIALLYLFSPRQGMLKFLMFGNDINGPIGIVIGSVFFTFPHAMIIISTALSISDARLFEASESLKASRWKTFWTVTIPGARYGLFSAAFVVFNLVITDFGLPKVIGGNYNVLAVDIFKQVIGQQNFEMGAVVSMVLLVPALLAFAIDRRMQKKQVALLTARSVVYEPKPNPVVDWFFFAYSSMVAVFIVGVIAVCQYAALIRQWPYNLSLSLKNYDFSRMDGGGWGAYSNSLLLAIFTAIIGTIVVFLGAYMVEKTKGFEKGRALFQGLAMLPMAIPGMVLGIAYIFFFNNPDNPLNFIYGTMIILVVSTVTHFYTVSHLTAVTALKQMDTEFESVSQSLKQPFYKLFWRVTVPVSLPAILNISIYLFVNAMTTVSAVVFLYSTDTALASVAVLNMNDAGDIAPAAAMGMMIFYTNAGARILHALLSKGILARSNAWRNTG